MQLLAQAIQALPRGHKAAFGDDGPTAGGLAAMIESKTGAGVNPVPAFGSWPCRRNAPLGDDLAAVQHGHDVAEFADHIHMVLDEEDADAAPVNPPDDLDQLDYVRVGQPRGGLVQDEQVGLRARARATSRKRWAP